MKTFCITTLGCKVNQYESDGIGLGLTNKGWKRTPADRVCDVCIINTCAVTSKAGMQSRQAIRKMMRENPDAHIIVTGCHADTEPDRIDTICRESQESFQDRTSKFHRVSHKDKTGIADHIDDICMHQFTTARTKCSDESKKQFPGFDHVVKGRMTRAYLKIQDGCEAFCSYCIVPYARGSYVSMPEKEVFRQLNALHDAGFKEVILTGIHTGMYGVDFKNPSSLLHLLEKINQIKPVHRIRLSSIEPGEISTEIIDLAAKGNIVCDHFHIPLQSGDNDILRQMKRPYHTDLFRNIILDIHTKLPFAGIGVDTLIGFPGESDQQFENTYQLIKSLPVSYLHVFPFSPRKGTPAASFNNQVHPHIIKERCARMRKLDKEKRQQFIKANYQRTLEGLVQHKADPKTGKLTAITSNYLTVLLSDTPELKGSIIDIELEPKPEVFPVMGKRKIQ